MPTTDPRPAPSSHAPALLGCGVVMLAATAGLGALRPLPTCVEDMAPRASAPHARRAPAAPSTPVDLLLRVRPGETLTAAVQRTGVAAAEARAVVDALGEALDTAHIRAGLALRAAVMRPTDGAGPARLMGLSLKTGPVSAVVVSRTRDGALNVEARAEPVRDETRVARGVMRQGSFYDSALAAGASPALVVEAVRLFSKSLDFARDLQPGDGFTLVFDRRATQAGRIISTGDLLYAEVAARGRTRHFYRFEHDGKAEYLDEIGKETKALLLKTPLDGARVTSAFGLRLHPLLGYTRLHPGVDFGAPTGTPVYAAGDGVVEEARWAGGYGHWLKLRHADGWETGYGHLSAYASGVKPGLKVRQGEVVAYVGSTGLSTGPHLHYEVMHGGAKLNPQTAAIPTGSSLDAGEVAAFTAGMRRIDALLAQPEIPQGAGVAQVASAPRRGA